MYTKEQLRILLIPLMFEQVLTALMGSVDTIMVTNIGSAAISAVSLVDSLNILIIKIYYEQNILYSNKKVNYIFYSHNFQRI